MTRQVHAMNEDKRPKQDANRSKKGFQPPPWTTDPFQLLQKFDDSKLAGEQAAYRRDECLSLLRLGTREPRVPKRTNLEE